MSFKRSRLVVLALALLALGFALTAPEITLPVQAQSCTHGATRWVGAGCCPCNVTKLKLQWCRNGVWTDTGTTDCRQGSCCAFPCCV